MNAKNILTASLIGAGVTIALYIVPFVSCLLWLPFCGPLLSVWFYKRQAGTITMVESISVGILTGLFVTMAISSLSLFGMMILPGLVDGPSDVWTQLSPLFSALAYGLISLLINIFFGVVAGLAGWAAFQGKNTSTLS